MTGQTISHYRILEKVGGGGMGVVYKAEDLKLGRTVAVKFLSEDLSQDGRALERFQREARSASALNHPNICTIHEVDEHEGRHFIVMELLEGEPLHHCIGGKPLQTELVLEVAVQIADALRAAHGKGIVHRDLKPPNIFLTGVKGQPLGPGIQLKLLDFGLAKFLPEPSDGSTPPDAATVDQLLSTPGTVFGTVPYMSPEQALGREVDHRTDLFSLGVVLYEMTTGRLPFSGATASETIVQIVRDPPETISSLVPEVPAELERIIRKCLEKDPERRYQTARELLVDVKNLKRDLEQSGQALIPSAARPASRVRRFAFPGLAAAALLTLLVAVYLVGWRKWLPWTAAPGRIESLAVLPLANLSGDPAQEYFADGMTDALIADLAQIRALRVISRTSVMQFKGTRKSLPEIAQQLRVDAVVEGSVLRSGQRVRIAAKLIRPAGETQLWASTYERDLGDILTLQNELARTIAGEIQVRVTVEEQGRLARARSVHPQAFDAYLKGWYFWSQFTEETFRKGIEQFEEAIRLDPGYAAAYAGLAEGWQALNYIGAAPYEEARPKALEAASKALQLDDQLAEAHAVISVIRAMEWDWPAAEKEFRRAIELNPGFVQAHLFATTQLRHLGRREESIAEAKRALELDPLALLSNGGLSDAYLSARQYDSTIQQCRRTLDLYPNHSESHYEMGWAYVYKQMYQEGIAEIEKSIQLDGDDPNLSPDLAYIYALQGKKGETLKILDRLLELSKQVPVSPGHMGLIYVSLGKKDEALTWLEKAYEQHSPMMPWLKVDPRFDPLREEPRFRELLRRVGLQ